jgi:Na+/H+ antiporter NhaD/arsenite permease-like protein
MTILVADVGGADAVWLIALLLVCVLAVVARAPFALADFRAVRRYWRNRKQPLSEKDRENAFNLRDPRDLLIVVVAIVLAAASVLRILIGKLFGL